jgi:hypothetical protein
MRLWSLHPRYLDARGLLALWREGLLARQVLLGRTRGYRHHPQLTRFRGASDPAAAIEAYLWAVWDEAAARGYAFDQGKLGPRQVVARMAVSEGQLRCELEHLRAKLQRRNPQRLATLAGLDLPDPHPLFRVVPGEAEEWERDVGR